MRSDRLLGLLLLLQTRPQWSAPELSRRLEVSVRTIYRDVEALSAAGVPVYSERGRNGGIAILPDFRTDMTGMTSEEARALFVTLDGAAHEQLGVGPELQSALRKVFAALPSAHRHAAEVMAQKLFIDQTGWGSNEVSPFLELLQRAVFEERRIGLLYERRDSDDPLRAEVDPYGLVSKAGAWYLVADFNGAGRMFRVDRVLDVRVLPEQARLRPHLELKDLWHQLVEQFDGRRTSIDVVLRIDRTELGLFLRVHGEAVVGHISRDDPPLATDGSSRVELTMQVQSIKAARVLLAFGAFVEVISPPEVIDYLDELVDGLIASRT
mgnify:CR=1 FL=1